MHREVGMGLTMWSTDYTTNYDQFIEKVKEDEKTFRPYGEKVHEYSLNDGKDHFEIYKVNSKTWYELQYNLLYSLTHSHAQHTHLHTNIVIFHE